MGSGALHPLSRNNKQVVVDFAPKRSSNFLAAASREQQHTHNAVVVARTLRALPDKSDLGGGENSIACVLGELGHKRRRIVAANEARPQSP